MYINASEAQSLTTTGCGTGLSRKTWHFHPPPLYIWKRAVNGSSVVQVHRKIYIGKNLTGEPGGDRRAAEERQTPPTTSSAGAAVTAAPTQPAAADGDGHADAASLAPPTAAATQIAAAAAVSSGSAVTPLAVAAQLPGVASGPVHPA